jgi:SAM-dependent methyltransferase
LALVGRPFWDEAGTAGCPHCGSPRLGNENPAQSWEYGGQTCTLLRCADCGGLFTFPWPAAALIERLYKEGFSYRWYGDHYPAKLLDALHRVLQYRALGVLGPGRVLDYGGGLGYFSQAARFFGYPAETRDPMYEKATAGDTSALARDYAVIACHHVLEHALAPSETLRDIRGRLLHGGRVILAVPNAGGRGYREQGSHWVWCQPPFIHLHHFTARGLRSLVERAGFVVESEHYFERWDASAVADLRLVQLFRHWDAGWGRARWKWGTAQRNSLLRFAALLWTELTSREPPAERAELLLVLRAADAAAPDAGAGQ